MSAWTIYGILRSSRSQGFSFEINPYDPCVANKEINGKQLTDSWHVDDLKISHIEPKTVDDFLTWIKATYSAIGEAKMSRDKVHVYLRIKLQVKYQLI
jgi:hypothetical protein